jgi:hypothetical protein
MKSLAAAGSISPSAPSFPGPHGNEIVASHYQRGQCGKMMASRLLAVVEGIINVVSLELGPVVWIYIWLWLGLFAVGGHRQWHFSVAFQDSPAELELIIRATAKIGFELFPVAAELVAELD